MYWWENKKAICAWTLKKEQVCYLYEYGMDHFSLGSLFIMFAICNIILPYIPEDSYS